MARKKTSGKRKGEPAKKKSSEKGGGRAKKQSGSPEGLVNYGWMKALSKMERVRIFAILCERVASPVEISRELGQERNLSGISYHVRVLRECGLIVLDHQVQRRGATEHFYRAATLTIVPPCTWDNVPPSVRESQSANILRLFSADALASMEAGVFDDSPGELSWTPLILDAPGIKKFGQLSRDFMESVLRLQVSASKRMSKGNGKVSNATSATVFLASFLSARSTVEGKKASAMQRR